MPNRPTCGCEFVNEDRKHLCEKPKTIDEYIALQPEEVQPLLNAIRDTIKKAIPSLKEKISWSMPTFYDKHNIIHFAAHRHHIGLYPGDKAIVHLADRLSEYKTSKGAIQLPFNKPLPLELIAQIAKWCYDTGNNT